MTFYLVGLGLKEDSLPADALRALKKCHKIYLENYTVTYPYYSEKLKIDFEQIGREAVEGEVFLDEAKEKDIALLVYGDSLSATTHIQLILSCKEKGIPYRIFHNASILTAVSETGLSLYKFGKTSSLPDWKQHTNKPKSFMDYIKDNKKIDAHTLVLGDIGLEYERAKEQLKESGFDTKEKIVVLSKGGTNEQKIFYGELGKIKGVDEPYCIIIPGKMSEYELEALKRLVA